MKLSAGDRILVTVIYILLAILAFLSFYPFWNAGVISFNNGTDTMRGELLFGPDSSLWRITRWYSRTAA